MIFYKVPRLLRWVFAFILFMLLLMTAYRLGFFLHYRIKGKPFSGSAFLLGLRYDARIVAVIGLFILLLCSVRGLNPFKNVMASKFWNPFISLVLIVMIIFYTLDFYHYDYLHVRLNATVLNYVEDTSISIKMIWQSYGVITGLSLLILLFAGAYFFCRWILRYFQSAIILDHRKGILYYALSSVLFGILIFGRLGQFPLRWSDAFNFNDEFKSDVALNPFQSFFSTLAFRHSSFDKEAVEKYYPLMASWLNVSQPDSTQLNFSRPVMSVKTGTTAPNIVLVICESFSAYKSSMYGNPLNTTPFFNEMSKNGVFYERCFSPTYGTARGVWATITGIPDVEAPSTASRNPSSVSQHTLINDFKGYERFYFLGGSASWANIRGLLTNNIDSLHLYEEGDYNARKVDVWGISDKNLFLAANTVLKQQDRPFFAVIQTADNHRPYTIPVEDRKVFEMKTFPEEELRKYGFESNEELNAFRYTDFCYQQFMEAARKEKYFNNTIFVFVGDHGIRGNAGEMFPKSWTDQGLTCEHIPLLFYAPGRLAPRRLNEPCSQVDILPSLVSLAGIPAVNTTMGRNLFDSVQDTKERQYAFIIDPDVGSVGILNSRYYYLYNPGKGKEDIVSMQDGLVIPTEEADSLKIQMHKRTIAWHQTAKYLLQHNRKK